jgi:hypothetical protein
MDLKARVVWKLSTNHTWGHPMPEENLVEMVQKDERRGEVDTAINEALNLTFVTKGPQGVFIPNGQRAQVDAAEWLRENTQRADFEIEATLSRLPSGWPDTEADGGIDVYDPVEEFEDG